MKISSFESQKGINAVQICCIENQKGANANAVQSLWQYSPSGSQQNIVEQC